MPLAIGATKNIACPECGHVQEYPLKRQPEAISGTTHVRVFGQCEECETDVDEKVWSV